MEYYINIFICNNCIILLFTSQLSIIHLYIKRGKKYMVAKND